MVLGPVVFTASILRPLLPFTTCLSLCHLLSSCCSFRQMAGRAGRAGIDTHGECILINQEIGVAAGEKLFTSGAAPVLSCLVDDKRGAGRSPNCMSRTLDAPAT